MNEHQQNAGTASGCGEARGFEIGEDCEHPGVNVETLVDLMPRGTCSPGQKYVFGDLVEAEVWVVDNDTNEEE